MTFDLQLSLHLCYQSLLSGFCSDLRFGSANCLCPSLTLKYQQCAKREGGKQVRGNRRGETDEGRTAAGGCHGNREDCYTAHVNRQELMVVLVVLVVLAAGGGW